jgi:hypothetical protein
MRNKIIALAATLALGTAAMTGSALAFGHGGGGGGHGGGFGGGHFGGGLGGGHFSGGFAGAHPAIGGFAGRGVAMNGGARWAGGGNWGRGHFGHDGFRRGFGIGGLGGLYAYSPGYDYGYCDPTDPNTYIYGYCNGFANGW